MSSIKMSSVKYYFNNIEMEETNQEQKFYGSGEIACRLLTLEDGTIAVKAAYIGKVRENGTFVCQVFRHGEKYLETQEKVGYSTWDQEKGRHRDDALFCEQAYMKQEFTFQIDLKDLYEKHQIPADEKLVLVMCEYQ